MYRFAPSTVPCLGPKSRPNHKIENAMISFEGQISKRITDQKLIDSLNRDTTIRIRPPATGDKRKSSNSSPRMKKKNTQQQPPTRFPSFNSPPYRRPISKPELDEMSQDFLDDPEKNIPDDILDCRYIKSQLKKLRSYYVQQRNYMDAFPVHKCLILLDAKIWELDHYYDKFWGIRHNMIRHQEIEQLVKRYLEEWEANFEDFLECIELEAEQIEEENRMELEEFDSLIPDELVIEFRKPSRRLLDIRQAERRLALDNQIASAIQLQKLADKLEEVEADNAYRKQQRIIRQRRNRVIKAQNNRINAFLEHTNSVKRVMIQTRDKLISGYMFRLKDLDKKLDQEAQELNIDIETICDPQLDEERADYVAQEEMGTKTPKSNPAAGFNSSRRRKANSATMRYVDKSQKSTITPVTPRQCKTVKRR
ncbi:hypothetical protein TRFO_24752 [Tritrichomonas foetus]|uniref:Uncharacterized protein n=1 Tax=Tritrichomonas foetus TaxID=1144522 RepID=A0A1J4K758_9EUKA|nr:hypothetical protein TRFO_24752 [Tritrichomonas foetus]|eukprot:OHT07027.1 hypothetical protein TRFO_24752 [Tritrichomonas foetus]